jgi:RNA polymerase sigma-70 factor (ECF subfamily)
VPAQDELAAVFQEHRGHLRAVAYRMLGSLSDAEDAVQEGWLRLSRTDVSGVANLGGWLTTVVGRVCLDMLRSRASRREDPLEARLPDPVVTDAGPADPAAEAERSDSIGMAMLVVLDTLPPAERVAFVLHDMFAVPFEDIAPIVDKTPAATRQLASRARRKVQGEAPRTEPDLPRQRKVVDAFLAAARGGDFEALLEVLDPGIVLRVDTGTGVLDLVRGAAAVAGRALTYAKFSRAGRFVLVNGLAGLLAETDGVPTSLMAYTIADDRVVELHIIADPARLAALGLGGDAPETERAEAEPPED